MNIFTIVCVVERRVGQIERVVLEFTHFTFSDTLSLDLPKRDTQFLNSISSSIFEDEILSRELVKFKYPSDPLCKRVARSWFI